MSTRFDWGTLSAAYRRGDTPMVRWGTSPDAISLRGMQPVYLATPYSKVVLDAASLWSERRSLLAMELAALELGRLKRHGVTGISPIVMSAALVHAGVTSAAHMRQHDPLDAVTWAAWCQPLLQVCRAIVVPDLQGWSRSAGIKAEVAHFIERNLPVFIYATGDQIEL